MGRLTDQRGFTLLEALIATAIFSLVFLGLTRVFSSNRDAFDLGRQKIEMQQSARVAGEALVRELRMAGYDPSSAIALQTPATALQSAQAGRVTFIADLDSDDVVERITYRLVGSTLLRDREDWNGSSFDSAVTSTMTGGVSVLSFSYLDASENAISAPVSTGQLGDVRRVVVDLTATRTGPDGSSRTFPVTLNVRLRNLG